MNKKLAKAIQEFNDYIPENNQFKEWPLPMLQQIASLQSRLDEAEKALREIVELVPPGWAREYSATYITALRKAAAIAQKVLDKMKEGK